MVLGRESVLRYSFLGLGSNSLFRVKNFISDFLIFFFFTAVF